MFQSTRPARDATVLVNFKPCLVIRFNPRAPRGTRHRIWSGRSWPVRVSIHAPRAGRDIRVNDQPTLDAAFQSTRPARDAT